MNAAQILVVQQAVRQLSDFRRTFNGSLNKARLAQFRRLECTLQHLELVDTLIETDLKDVQASFEKLEGGGS